MARYAGWKNYQTWNVALWIQSDAGWHAVAVAMPDYPTFVEYVRAGGLIETPDRVALNDSGLDIRALNRLIRDLKPLEAV